MASGQRRGSRRRAVARVMPGSDGRPIRIANTAKIVKLFVGKSQKCQCTVTDDLPQEAAKSVLEKVAIQLEAGAITENEIYNARDQLLTAEGVEVPRSCCVKRPAAAASLSPPPAKRNIVATCEDEETGEEEEPVVDLPTDGDVKPTVGAAASPAASVRAGVGSHSSPIEGPPKSLFEQWGL